MVRPFRLYIELDGPRTVFNISRPSSIFVHCLRRIGGNSFGHFFFFFPIPFLFVEQVLFGRSISTCRVRWARRFSCHEFLKIILKDIIRM